MRRFQFHQRFSIEIIATLIQSLRINSCGLERSFVPTPSKSICHGRVHDEMRNGPERHATSGRRKEEVQRTKEIPNTFPSVCWAMRYMMLSLTPTPHTLHVRRAFALSSQRKKKCRRFECKLQDLIDDCGAEAVQLH